jgi:fibronectin-binding protein
MKRNWVRRILAFAALALTASATFGNAFFGSNPQTGSLAWDGFSNGSVVTSISGPGFTGNVLAGQFQGRFNPSSEPDGTLGPDDFFRFFCIDITSPVDSGPDAYTRVLGVSDATKGAELSQLFNQFYPNKSQSTYYNGGQTTFGDFPDADTSAAFQIAVWEILFDTNLNRTSGTFTANSSASVNTLVDSYLSYVGAHPGDAPGWTFFEFTNDNFQDYLSVEYTQPLRTVPEPGSFVLFCSAVLVAWAAALRRRQTA